MKSPNPYFQEYLSYINRISWNQVIVNLNNPQRPFKMFTNSVFFSSNKILCFHKHIKKYHHHQSLGQLKLKSPWDTIIHATIKIKKNGSTKCWPECGATGTLIDFQWEGKIVQTLWKIFSWTNSVFKGCFLSKEIRAKHKLAIIKWNYLQHIDVSNDHAVHNVTQCMSIIQWCNVLCQLYLN